MANIDNPHGFKPWNNKPLRVTAYAIEAAYATALYVGDMVTLTSGYITIGESATDKPLLGCIVGFECSDGGMKEGGYYPASSPYSWKALVADDPYQRFEAQDDAGGTLAIANIGTTVNIQTTHSGNTSTNLSGQEIDASATGGAVTDQLRLIGLVNRSDNAWGDNGEYIVEIHNHVLRQENNVDATE